MTRKDVSILLVDDDKVDMMAMRRSFRDLKIENPVFEAGNGIEALCHLRGEHGYPKVPQPCLVLLDLNMPRMSGIEFLQELRGDPSLHRITVFVMTTSAAEEDLDRAYDKHVAGYLLKQQTGRSFHDAIRMLKCYWQSIEFPN
jgi:CheY-like chemotaxis protein